MSTPNTRLKFAPYDEQREVLDSPARFRVVAAGRRSGKTLMAGFETVRRALEGGEGWRGYWVGAEHQHAKTAYRLIDNVLPDAVVERRNRSAPRMIELSGDRTIEFHTAGGGALVSVGLDWVVCDEAGKSFPERSWTQELRPALSDRDGEAMFISTPDGRGWFHKAYQRGQGDDAGEWASWRWASYANPHVDDSEIDAARDEIPDRVFRQEYLAEFISETGGVFEGLDERLFTADYTLPERGLPPAPDDPGDRSPHEVYAEPPYATGLDLARHTDYRVIVTVDATGRIVHFDRAQGEAWPQIQNVAERVAERYPGVMAVDASRDNKLVGDLERAGVNVVPVTFGGGTKQDLIENLVATVEAGDLSAPDIPALRSELEVFEFEVTRAGNVKYHAPEGFHDDTVDAFALAVDQMDRVTRQAVGDTARVGGGEAPQDASDGLDAYVKGQAQQRHSSGWK